jgi:hypothetical protein
MLVVYVTLNYDRPNRSIMVSELQELTYIKFTVSWMREKNMLVINIQLADHKL